MSKCTYVAALTLGTFQCNNEAEWNNLCPAHGGTYPTEEELMVLLAKLTKWGDQSLAINVGYKRARVYIAQDESSLNDAEWGFTVSTKVLGYEQTMEAQGPNLRAALWALCEVVVKRIEEIFRKRLEDSFNSSNDLNKFIEARMRAMQQAKL